MILQQDTRGLRTVTIQEGSDTSQPSNTTWTGIQEPKLNGISAVPTWEVSNEAILLLLMTESININCIQRYVICINFQEKVYRPTNDLRTDELKSLMDLFIYLMTLSITRTTSLRMFGWLSVMNLARCKTKRSWPNLKDYPNIYAKGLRKTTKRLSQGNRCPDRDSI